MAMRVVGLFLVGGGLAAGVYFLTLPDCKKTGHGDDAAAVSTAAPAVVSSRT